MVSGASYIIFEDSGTYYAKNDTSGGIELANTNASYVLQSIINALPEIGGKLSCKGEFTFNYGFTITHDNVVIEGESSGEHIYGTTFYKDFDGDLITIGDASSGPGGLIGRAWNIALKHFSIYDLNAPSSKLGKGLVFEKAAFVLIEDVFIKDIHDNAVHVLDTWGIQIANSEFGSCGNTSLSRATIRVEGSVAGTNLTTDVRINNCAFEDGSYRDIDVFGFEIDYCAISTNYFEPSSTDSDAAVFVCGLGVIVSDNFFLGGGGDAIRNGKVGYGGYGTIISGNHIQGFGGDGVDSTYGGWGSITSNYISSCDGVGVRGGTRQSISQNTVIACGMEGIFVANVNTTISSNIVNANMLTGGLAGILTYGADTLIFGNIVMDSTIIATQTTGIRSSNVTCRIFGNGISGATTPILAPGTLPVVFGNTGYITENKGTSTITASTSIVFNHGLVTTPTFVSASFSPIGWGNYTWTATTTQITITVSTSGTYTVYWYAEV
jgi:hypothetical protein